MIFTKKSNQFKIYVGRKSYFDYIEMIKPHVEWDCFKYKIDTSGYNKKPHVGEDHSGSKMTNEQIKEIFKLKDEGMLQKEIAQKIGVSKTCVSLVLSGSRWGHLGMKRDAIKKPRTTEDTKNQILALRSQGMEQKEIAEVLNTTQSTVSRVLKRGVPSHA